MSAARRRHVSLLPAVIGVEPESSRARRWWTAVHPGEPLADPALVVTAQQVAYTVYHPGEESISWSYEQISEPTTVEIGADAVRVFGTTTESAVAMRWNPPPTGLRKFFPSRQPVSAGARFAIDSIGVIERGRVRDCTQVRIDFVVDVFRCVLFFETEDEGGLAASVIERWATGLAGEPKSFGRDDHRWERDALVPMELDAIDH